MNSRVLLVEDDAAIALALRDDLTLEGYAVHHVRTSEAALDHVLEEGADLVLLDVMLPGRDGFDLCRDLRRRGLSVPILFLTARSLEAEKVLGFELGADDYLTKPYSGLELRARVKALIRRVGGGCVVHRFGDVELDLGRWELRRGGTALACSATELKVLAALVNARGRVLSRRQIIDHVWGPHTFITERAVDNHVVAIRRKIEADPEAPQLLASVRGIGYRFDA